MCSNFQSITNAQADWVQEQFQCVLPLESWREEIYPAYQAPFIWLDEGKPRCDLAEFGLVSAWAADKAKFGLHTYNARSETIATKPSYRNAWKKNQFGLAVMQSFYEPNYGSGKAIRWRIKRLDSTPIAVASIWERFVHHDTGEIKFSFSMVTVNADQHKIMRQFHKPGDEKRAIVTLQDTDYHTWLQVKHEQAPEYLKLSPDNFLEAEPAPRKMVTSQKL
ncbi:MAG: SOS response-associated peptidase [Methyloglobulus sp.]|nr:SOS response-associated peptidase [Methyloglobulus sp.]